MKCWQSSQLSVEDQQNDTVCRWCIYTPVLSSSLCLSGVEITVHAEECDITLHNCEVVCNSEVTIIVDGNQ